MPRSLRSGRRRTTRSSADKLRTTSSVPSVEWLSTTITLNLNVVSCDSADFIASAIVRTRLRTGIITEATTGKAGTDTFSSVVVCSSRGRLSDEGDDAICRRSLSSSRNGTSSNSSGANHAPMALRCAVHARSISICTSRAAGFT